MNAITILIFILGLCFIVYLVIRMNKATCLKAYEHGRKSVKLNLIELEKTFDEYSKPLIKPLDAVAFKAGFEYELLAILYSKLELDDEEAGKDFKAKYASFTNDGTRFRKMDEADRFSYLLSFIDPDIKKMVTENNKLSFNEVAKTQAG